MPPIEIAGISVAVGPVVRVALSVDDPILGLSAAIPVALIDHVVITADANLDVRGLHFDLKDGVTIADLAALTSIKTFPHQVFADDVFAKVTAFDRRPADAVAVSDAFARVVAFNRQPADAVAMADAFARTVAFTRTFADTAVMSDSASATDGTVTTVQKVFADAIAAADAYTRVLGKVLADAAVTSDAGSVQSQGYCNVTYFAEAYVGDSRTF